MRKIFLFLRNRYFLFTAFMVVWMTFFDRFNVIRRYSDIEELKQLQEKEMYYKQETEKVQKSRNELLTNPSTLERFARERYYMKKEGEDVFIVEE